VVFEPATSANETPQSHALNRAPARMVLTTYFETQVVKVKIPHNGIYLYCELLHRINFAYFDVLKIADESEGGHAAFGI
jgi:hypothetical protein